jgi:hypothetical protein
LATTSRATVAQDAIQAYNDLKLNKKYKYIIYKLSDDYKEIVVEEASDSKDWEAFREHLINATSKSKSVCGFAISTPHLGLAGVLLLT